MSETLAALPFFKEARRYVGNIRQFHWDDWLRYGTYIAMLSSLLIGVSCFLLFGASRGVVYPGYVWVIPFGIVLFVGALAFDDIGHRTLYKEQLKKGEAYVHLMIIITAVTSVMSLCLCFQHGATFEMPALALIGLSLFYSIIDEALHWHRYLKFGLDRVEMWSHFVAITGHVLMISCWWHWYSQGYPGVAQTLALLPQGLS